LIYQAALFFPLPLVLYAQVTTDFQRPFDQGRVIELPGTSEYQGDLQQEIEWESDFPRVHTLEGILNQEIGWVPTSTGTDSASAQALFEGIPYPFPSSNLLTWVPAFRNFELLNFPASGWWGPSSAVGAVQIRLPDETNVSRSTFGGWGGSGGVWGGEGDYENPDFSMEGSFQHGSPNSFASTDALNILFGSNLTTNDSLKIKTGFLGAEWFGGDNWYSWFGSLKWESANFQSLEFKPFVQSAELNGVTVQEVGSDLNYHFTMGGLVESQLGFGLSHDDFSVGAESLNKGYVQNLEIINVLDDFKLNMAFRMDFSSTMEGMFSTTLGSQYRLGDFSIIGSYSKSVEPLSLTDVIHGDLGILYQPTDSFLAAFRVLTEMFENSWWTGGRAKIEYDLSGNVLGLLRELKFRVENQFLESSSGGTLLDTAGRVEWSFDQPLTFWFEARGFSERNFYTDGGIDCLITRQTKIYASIVNIGNYPAFWPDSTTPEGRIAWLGIETGF